MYSTRLKKNYIYFLLIEVQLRQHRPIILKHFKLITDFQKQFTYHSTS